MWQRVSPKWRRLIKVIGGVALVLVALNAWLSLSFSALRLDHERHQRVAADIRALSCQIDSFKTRSGSFPSSLAALKAVPKDPWDSEYIYRYPGTHNRGGYDLFSASTDRKPDTPDDDWGQ
jgi:general secretion pathway protein G